MPYARPSAYPSRDRHRAPMPYLPTAAEARSLTRSSSGQRRRAARQRCLRRLLRDQEDLLEGLLLERSFKAGRRGRFSQEHSFQEHPFDGDFTDECLEDRQSEGRALTKNGATQAEATHVEAARAGERAGLRAGS